MEKFLVRKSKLPDAEQTAPPAKKSKPDRKSYDQQRYALQKEKPVFWDPKWKHGREWLTTENGNAVCTCKYIFNQIIGKYLLQNYKNEIIPTFYLYKEFCNFRK